MIDRIAILGGSSVYIPEFLLSIISHNINVKEIALVGRPGKKLGIVAGFCSRLLRRSGFPAEIVATTDVEEGVAKARYIVNHIRVGGMQGRIRDEGLPPHYGMIGDQSLGAGGFANAMRTLPVLMDLVQRIEKATPDATIINLTSPVGVCVDAIIRTTKLNVIGVCDLPHTYTRRMAELLRVEPELLWIDYIGLSQMGWIQDVKVENRSCMSKLLDRLEQEREDGYDYDLIELFRMIPTRQTSLYFHQDEILKKQKECGLYRGEILHEAEQQILKLYEDPDLCEIPELTRARNANWYEETIVPLIQALESKKERETILCVRNNGSIRDLPDDCSVEVPVQVSKKGITPRKVGNCPRFLRGLFLEVKESERLTVEAVRHRSYECALQALTINPFVPSIDAARKFLDRIIKDNKIELR
ncbi:MAG: 6-phospho-beta-glucosidase [Candidatus Hydrogenedentota bacterium]